MWEETLGFFVLLVPLALALGYDRMVAAAIIFLGAGTGVLCSTVNPFATGVASDAAGISLGDGIGVRSDVDRPRRAGDRLRDPLRIAGRQGPGALGRRDRAHRRGRRQGLISDVPALTGRQKLVLVLFAGSFLVMIYGFIPWNDLWQEGWGKDFPLPTFSAFYFPEAAALFFVMAVVIGLIAKLGEEGTVNTIIAGAADFLGAALIIVLARGITVVMKNTYMTDTVLHWMEDAVSGTSKGVFGVITLIVNIPIAFLVPSSSGHAALVMPILAPLADFADVARSVAVTAYQSASGPREPAHPDLRGDHGRPRPLQGGLRPLPEVRLAVRRRRLRRRLPVRRRRGRPESERRTRGNPVHHPRARRRSEVGTLRSVIVHRPDLAHERLSPTNCHELLFDDVIWVRRARQEFDAFVDLMRDARRGGAAVPRAARRDARGPRRRASGCSSASCARRRSRRSSRAS